MNGGGGRGNLLSEWGGGGETFSVNGGGGGETFSVNGGGWRPWRKGDGTGREARSGDGGNVGETRKYEQS